MAPRKFKVNHHRDKGTSYAGFIERNAEVLPEHMLKKRNQNRAKQEKADGDSDSDDSQVATEQPAGPLATNEPQTTARYPAAA